jgi:hypothetical protein
MVNVTCNKSNTSKQPMIIDVSVVLLNRSVSVCDIMVTCQSSNSRPLCNTLASPFNLHN